MKKIASKSRDQRNQTDFEHLSQLFTVDPEAFELERKRIIEEEIASRPPEIQQSLRQFQWVLDMKRKRCKTPLEACFMFHEMLMNNVYGDGGILEGLETLKELVSLRDSNAPVTAMKSGQDSRHNPLSHNPLSTDELIARSCSSDQHQDSPRVKTKVINISTFKRS